MTYRQMSDRQIFASRGIGEEPFEINELLGKYKVDYDKKVVYQLKGKTRRNVVGGLYESLLSGKWSIRHRKLPSLKG